jgi:hypothetical protein
MVSSGGGDPPWISSGIASSVATGVGGAPRFRAGLRLAALARLAGGRRLAAGRRLALGRRFPVVRRFEVARRFVADTVKCLPITRLSLLAARSPLFAENNGDQLDSAGQAFLNITSFTDFALAGNRGKDSNRALQLGQCQRWRMTLSSKSSVLRGAIISCSHRTQRIPNMNIERRLFIV